MLEIKVSKYPFGVYVARLASLLTGIVLALVGFFALGSSSLRAADSSISKEYQIKAAFLYNFTKFVEWPPTRFADASSPIIIGVMGQNPFGDELEKTLRDRKVNGRSLAVQWLGAAAEAKSVHVLFFPEGEERALPELAQRLEKSGILTVGESSTFMNLGGMISFTMVGDKVRFEINVKMAEKNGLKISAQLQKLATRVERSP